MMALSDARRESCQNYGMEPVPDEGESGRMWADETGEPHKMKSSYRPPPPSPPRGAPPTRGRMLRGGHGGRGVPAQSFAGPGGDPGIPPRAHMPRGREEFYHTPAG